MNLSHTLYFIPDAKALSSILCSSGNIQIKSCWDPVDPPPLSYIKLAKTPVYRGLKEHVQTTDSVWAVVLENMLLLKVTITSASLIILSNKENLKVDFDYGSFVDDTQDVLLIHPCLDIISVTDEYSRFYMK